MELKRYLRVVRRHRAAAVTAFLVTSALTWLLTSMQSSVWEATGTAVIKPSITGTDTESQDRMNERLDILSRSVKFGETYAMIAESELIRDQAERHVSPAIDVDGVTVNAEVVTDTNLLLFTTTGPDPEAAEALGTAVMDATIAFVDQLNDGYVISPLDAAEAGSQPVGPNKGLTIAIGLILGMLLAVVLALFAEYLEGHTEADDVAEDERTGLHATRYLRARLREEMSRADRTTGEFALASFGVALHLGEGWRTPSDPELRKIGEVLKMTVGNDVVIAHLGDGEFAALLPERDRSEAEALVARWESAVGAVLEGFVTDPEAVPGFSHSIVRYRDASFDGDREAVRIARLLVGRSAPTVVRGQLSIASEHPVPRAPRAGTQPANGGNGSRQGAVQLAPAAEAPAAPPAVSAAVAPAAGPAASTAEAPAPQQGASAAKPSGAGATSGGGSAPRRNQRSKASKRKPRAATRRR